MIWDQQKFERSLRRTLISLCIFGVCLVLGLIWLGFLIAGWMQ